MRVMGCHHSSTIDSSRIWTNIQRPTRELSANTEDTSNQKPSKRYNKSGKQRGKRSKTYFEPCLLYVNEPGHSNYQLNDLGLYEQDIHLSFKKPLIKKRPKCKGLWEDKSFDEENFDHYGEIKLIRSKELRSNEGECSVEDLTSEFESRSHSDEFINMQAAIGILEDDQFLLNRVVPLDQSSKYDGIFHCRFCGCGVWEDVYIDDRLPVGGNGAVFGNQCILKQLLIKAFGKYLSSTSKLGTQKFLDIYRCLTGGTGNEIKLINSRQGMTNIISRMKNALNQGSFVMCSVGCVGDHDELGLQRNGIYQVKNILQLNRIRNASVTLVELRSWSDRTCWKGPWSKRSTEWDLVESRIDIPASTSEKDFHMPIEYFMTFMENVTLCNLIPEQDRLESEERSNYITKIYSKWKGLTAGGLNYLRNPKYLIMLSEKGVETDGKVRLVLILEQTTQILNMAAIRVKLYKVHVDCDQGFIIEDMTEEGICLKRVTVTTSLRVEPGQYVIVPHTDREGVETEFMLAVFTPTPLPNVRPLSDGTAVLLTKGHTVSFSKAMKIDATLCHVNHLWGQWNLSDGQSRELHKSPQFEICITHIGAPTTVRFLLLKDNLQPEACTGVRIFKMSEGQTIPCNKEWLEAVWNDPVKCHDGSIEGWHWDHIAPTYCLHPGRYAVIAWADKTNYKCTFCLVAHSSSSIEVK